MKKFILGVFVFSIAFVSVNSASATVSELDELQSQLATLLSQVATIQARIQVLQSTNTGGAFCYNVKGFLGRGDATVDVATLHTALIRYGYGSDISAGEIANHIYGEGTSIAVAKLQGAQGFRSIGNVGPQTDAFLKRVFPCSKEVVPPATSIVITGVRGPTFPGMILAGRLATINYTGTIDDSPAWKIYIRGKAQEVLSDVAGGKVGALDFTVPNLPAGTYDVFLVKNGKELSNKFSVQLIVPDTTQDTTNKFPRVSITSVSALRVKVNETVTVRYTAADPEGQSVTTRVTWGDEPISTEARFVVKTVESDSHTYTAAGEYTIAVSATDGVNVARETRQITVVADPVTLESKVNTVTLSGSFDASNPIPAGTYIDLAFAGQNIKGTVAAKLYKYDSAALFTKQFVENIRTGIPVNENGGGTLGFNTAGFNPGYYVVQIIPTGITDDSRGALSRSFHIVAAAPAPTKNPAISNVLLNGLASSFSNNRGDSLNITWTRNDDVAVNKIEILNYTKVVRTITTSATEQYVWKVPADLPLGTYWVRVWDKTGVSAVSASSFTVVAK